MIYTYLFIVITVASVLALIYLFIHLLFKNVIIRFKQKTEFLSIEDVITAVNLVIRTEISLYERNVFDNGGRILTNSSYENYYRDITENILKALSKDIIDKATFYFTKESLYSMISREVKIYLNDKII